MKSGLKNPRFLDLGSGRGSDCVATVIASFLKACQYKILNPKAPITLEHNMNDPVDWLLKNTDLSEFGGYDDGVSLSVLTKIFQRPRYLKIGEE